MFISIFWYQRDQLNGIATIQLSKLAIDSYAAPWRSMLTKETGPAHPVNHYEIVGLGSIMGISPFNWSNASERSISALYLCVNT